MTAPRQPAASSESLAARRVGRYVLFEEFARGGMASVHLARLVGAAGFSRVVAVKRVRSVFIDSDEHRRSILSEARIASRIQHPNVVQTLDIVVDEGIPHVVMEYVHGATAAALFAEAKLRGERIPVPIAVGVVVDALQGLHAAHEARDANGAPLGLVHRDVSPQNVHVGMDGRARLLDFGIAKVVGRTQATEPGVVKGKIAYMPREQLGGAPVTRQVDVYAAGVVLWELLTGERLFDDDEVAIVATRVLTEPILRPSAYAPEVSLALDDVVLRATAVDPRQRYGTAAEMAAALTSAAARAEPHEIGAWVERLAGDELELRAESVRRAEAAEIHDLPMAPRPPLGASTRRLVVTCAVLASAAFFVIVAIAATRSASPRSYPLLPSAAAAPPSAAPSPPLPPEVAPVASAVAVTPAAVASSPPGAASAAPLRTRPTRRRPAPSCDPPFSIQADGTKKYKAECLR